MKLSDAIEIAKECGLETYEEAIYNIDIHAMNIFEYEKINEEMAELLKDFKSSGKSMDDKF